MERADFMPEDWHGLRRVRALELKQQGWYQRDIAGARGAREETVSRWLARARQDGPESLRNHPAPGPAPRLSPQQKRLIPEFLWHGPEPYAFPLPVWPRARLA